MWVLGGDASGFFWYSWCVCYTNKSEKLRNEKRDEDDDHLVDVDDDNVEEKDDDEEEKW